MTKRRILLSLTGVALLAGILGFSLGYATNNQAAREAPLPFDELIRLDASQLAYAFAPAAQVRQMIEGEPPQPARWAHTESRVQLFRTLRLAVVAEDETQREGLLKKAESLCEECEPEDLRRMLERYAQQRLVPPGDEISCEACGRPRQPLPEPQ